MATVRCGNCGAEVVLPEKSEVTMGVTMSKKMKGDYVLPMLERNTNNKTNTIEYGTNNNVREEKENVTMVNNNVNNEMGNLNIDVLAEMVANRVKNEIANSKVSSPVVNVNENADGGSWAKGSKNYGKTFCGFPFNPYMVRWHLQKEYEEMLDNDKRNANVYKQINNNYTYEYSIEYTIEECRKLAMLQKRDFIAFDERRHGFTLRAIRKIMCQYLDDVKTEINHSIDTKLNNVTRHNIEKGICINMGRFGYKSLKIKEVVENHKVKCVLTDESKIIVDTYLNTLDGYKVKINSCWTYEKLYKNICGLYDKKDRKLIKDNKKSYEFMDSFIRCGAYYTLKQNLMFNPTYTWREKSGRVAILELMGEYARELDGYCYHAMLKDSMGYETY